MTETEPRPDEDLAGQRVRLRSLEACEEAIRDLRDRESDLEVEHMAAEAALRSATARLEPGIDAALAARIGLALERRDDLESRARHADKGRTARSADRLDALRAGRAALESWLDSSGDVKPGGAALAARVTLLVATIAAIWLAIAVHPAFLVLILVVIGPVSFALGRGQDREWRRAGARRRFDASGLAGISDWNDETVRGRMGELDELLAAAAAGRSRGGDTAGPIDTAPEEALAAEIADVETSMAADLASAGLSLDDTRGEKGSWLRLAAREEETRACLERVKRERGRLRSEAAELRDRLQGYLQSRGVRPTEQPETAAEIAARLDGLTDDG